MDEILENLVEIEETIENIVNPIFVPLKKMGKHKDIKSKFIKRFLSDIGVHANDKYEAVIVIEDFMGEIVHEIDLMKKFIKKNPNGIKEGSVRAQVMDEVIDNFSGSVLYTTDILTTMFIEDFSDGKRQELIHGLKAYVETYKAIANDDIVETIESIPAGITKDLIKGFVEKDSIIGIEGFIGSIVYTLGKYKIQWNHKKVKLLKERIEFMRVEIMILESENPDGLEKKSQYYRDKIEEMEIEISTLQR